MAMPVRDALLAAKLDGRARGARVVDRARLRALLDAAPEARLVLVAAPAGFGKTTLLAAWVGAADVRSAWLVARPARRRHRPLRAVPRDRRGPAGGPDRGDHRARPDPALRPGARPRRRPRPGRRGARGRAGRRGGARARRLPRDRRARDPSARHVARRAAPGRGRGWRSRPAPTRRSPLARLRARGELLELRAEDLRFTESEAGELLRAAAVELDPAAVAELVERTEGWAAVLRLAAISLRGRPDQAEQVRRFGASHRFVLDYVVEEVLGGLPFETQDFLLRTSVLDRLCGPLCDAVTGHANGQARLEELERANLLIIPLDDERRWYRYHALFAEVLRARLRILHRDDVPGLHARAATWLAAQGDDDEAIAHALRAGDLERTCAMIAEASLRWLNAGELRTVRRWLDALPADALRGHPQLSASYAWCLVLPGETEGVAERLADAERALAVDHDGDAITDAAVRTQLALIRSRLADLEGDAPTAIAQARLAGELVPAGLPPEAETTLRGDATVLLARALAAAGDIDGAAEAYEASLPDLRAGGNVFAADRAIADLAAIAIARGDAPGCACGCARRRSRGRRPESAATAERRRLGRPGAGAGRARPGRARRGRGASAPSSSPRGPATRRSPGPRGRRSRAPRSCRRSKEPALRPSPPAGPGQPGRGAHRPRDRGPAPGRSRPVQQPDRDRAVRDGGHGQVPSPHDLGQARGRQPGRGRRARPGARLARLKRPVAAPSPQNQPPRPSNDGCAT